MRAAGSSGALAAEGAGHPAAGQAAVGFVVGAEPDGGCGLAVGVVEFAEAAARPATAGCGKIGSGALGRAAGSWAGAGSRVGACIATASTAAKAQAAWAATASLAGVASSGDAATSVTGATAEAAAGSAGAGLLGAGDANAPAAAGQDQSSD